MVFWDQIVIKVFAVLTVIGQIVILMYLLDLFSVRVLKRKLFYRQWKFFGKHAIAFSFVVSLLAMIGSLIFSELLHFTPCTLCWYQRILMYPQVFLAGFALFRKEKKGIMPYLMLLSIIGLFLAGFHYYNQVSENPVDIPCSALGYSASCSDSFFAEFGYVTIPLMAFTAFAMIIVLYFLSRRN